MPSSLAPRDADGGDARGGAVPVKPASPRVVALTLAALVLVAVGLPLGFAVHGTIQQYRQVHALHTLTVKWTFESGMFVVGACLAYVLLRVSLVVAYRARPVFLPMTEEDMLLENYRGAFERFRPQVERVVPALVAIFAGATAAGQWKKLALWWNGGTFGVSDPSFDKDAGFYVFTVPWLRFLVGYLTMLLVLALLAAVIGHVIHGGVTMRGIPLEGGRRTTRAARVHLSTLLAGLFVCWAASSTVSRYELAVGGGPRFAGMNHLGERVLDPAHATLAVLAACVAGLLLSVWRTDAVRLPLTGAAVLTIISVIGLDVAAPLYDRLSIQPNAARLEPVHARQAMTAQAEGFDLTDVRQDTLPTGPVPASARSDARRAVEAAFAEDPDAAASPATSDGSRTTSVAAAATKSADDPDPQLPLVRVGRVAPWLTLDRHPYRVGSGTQRVWVVDGYTTSSTYPGSQLYRLGASDGSVVGTADGPASGVGVNYVRDAVKATVAQDGRVTLYAAAPKDPVLRAWRSVFHTSLRSLDEMPQAVRQGLRYPQDLFTVQRDVLARYHSRSTSDFLTGSAWQAPTGPGVSPAGLPAEPTRGPVGIVDGRVTSGISSALVAGDSGMHLRALMTGQDAGTPGPVTLASIPDSSSDRLPDPGAWSRGLRTSAQEEPKRHAKLSDVVAEESKRQTVTFEPVAVLRVGSGVMYAEQITSVGQQRGARPRVIAVALRTGQTTAWGLTTDDALDALFTRTGSTSPRTSALDDAQQALDDANAAQARGDEDAYTQAERRLQTALDQARTASK